MKSEFSFPELDALKAKMGAKTSSWSIGESLLDPLAIIKRELEVGKVIPIADVKSVGGTLLTYMGEQVVLYIKDTRQDRETLLYDKEKAKKFHIAECRTLDNMRQQGRYERYVVTTSKSGIFQVEAKDKFTNAREDLETSLFVCKNCLTVLDWKGYKSLGAVKKSRLRDDFSLEDFFAEFSTFFLSKPKYSDVTAPKGGYATDWSRISEQRREERGWRCDDCNVYLAEHRSLLHCHHKNGVVTDNRRKNHEVLCILCHSKKPAHNHLKPKPKDRMLIEKLKIHQRLELN